MSNVVIYYKMDNLESSEQAVLRVNNLIDELKIHHTVKGVFLENENESSELMDILNSPLSEIDYIYINKPFDNEFDNRLINEVSRTEQFEIILFD